MVSGELQEDEEESRGEVERRKVGDDHRRQGFAARPSIRSRSLGMTERQGRRLSLAHHDVIPSPQAGQGIPGAREGSTDR
jgi:hypothetical protein